GIPVIPVFWIAGEDHDYEEINHVYLEKSNQLQQYKVGQYIDEKRSISNIELDHKEMNSWLQEAFKQLGETRYTRELYDILNTCKDRSITYVDFFARVINVLFKDSGLVLVDSGNPKLRQMESEHFIT